MLLVEQQADHDAGWNEVRVKAGKQAEVRALMRPYHGSLWKIQGLWHNGHLS